MKKTYTKVLSIVFSLQLLTPALTYTQSHNNIISIEHQGKKKNSSEIKKILKLILGMGETGLGLTQLYLYYMLNKAHFNKDFPKAILDAIKALFEKNNASDTTTKIRTLFSIVGSPLSGLTLTGHGIKGIVNSLEG